VRAVIQMTQHIALLHPPPNSPHMDGEQLADFLVAEAVVIPGDGTYVQIQGV
jgi:hypothetical protein